jgi:hemerythrin-like domain-containing protein
MKPIENLKREHEEIVLMLNVLERISANIEAGQGVPIDNLKRVLDFLQTFGDKCHYVKEERFLFTAMEEAGVQKGCGPLGLLLSDHATGREFIGEMNKLLNSYEKGRPGSEVELATVALEYVHLFKNHIWKENIVLFPIAEKTVPADKLKSIGEQFDRFEKEQKVQGVQEAFDAMIDELAGTYL